MLYLVTLYPHDGTSERAVRLSSEGYTSRPEDTPPSVFFADRVRDAGLFEQHIFSGGDGISGGTTRGESSSGAGDIVVVNNKPYGYNDLLDDWLYWAWSGRRVVIQTLENGRQALSSAVTVFTGTIARLAGNNAKDDFSIVIRSRLADLETPLLTVRYAGTTTEGFVDPDIAEGTEDLKDKIKPRIWGTRNNVSCEPVNPLAFIYQVSAGAVSSIAVSDSGFPLAASTDYLTPAALLAATIVPGTYATCLAQGLFRLGGPPFGAVTAAVSEGATWADRTAAQIAKRMLAHAGYSGSDIVASSFAALDAKNSAECGIVVNSDEDALQAIQRLLNSVGGYLIANRLGQFEVGRLDAPSGTPVATFSLSDNIGGPVELIATGDEDDGVPVHKVTVRFDQIVAMQRSETVGGTAEEVRRAYLESEWRERVATNSAILTRWPKAPSISVDTGLVTSAAAEAEAARLLALYSAQRLMFRIRLPFETAGDCVLGSVVQIVDERFDLGAGRLFVVLGRTEEFGAADRVPAVILELWG